MKLLGDVLSELFGMFVADARLTVAILALVALSAVLTHKAGLAPLVGGVVLLLGCVVVLLLSVRREAVRRRAAERATG